MTVLGIIGWPLEMTLSPKLHEYLFKITSISGQYDKLPIEKINDLALKELMRKYIGINVTIPHKQSVYRELKDISNSSKSVEETQVVNTIVKSEEAISLHNTDYKGFLAEISRLNYKLKNKTILILGRGGSSKSIQYALQDLNTTEIYVVSRTPQNHQLDYADIDSVSDEIDMIINTTPLGMPPYQNQSPIEESIKFNNLEIVLDIGYNNKESKFMKQFKNVEVANGLGMLIAQGIESFNLWTKSKLSFTDLYKEIKELLEEEIHD